ncbi:MAG: TadE-like protein [Chloroflexota bacterium]|jgi:Flp pilus assembly protein TadG|nr:TadE-like protein [Chloroflexota bacterium]
MMKRLFRRGSRSAMTPRRGQSMVEFALIAPTFFLLIFGIVEFGILMFDVASSRFATGEAAKVEAYTGSSTDTCSNIPGCTLIHAASFTCDADCRAAVSIRRSPVGTTSLETVNWIEVRQCPNAACPNPSCTNAAHTLPAGCTSGTYVVRTGLDACLGTDMSHCATYPATGRSTSANAPEYLQLTLSYRYDWKTGILKAVHNAPVDLNATYLLRIEPQKF